MCSTRKTTVEFNYRHGVEGSWDSYELSYHQQRLAEL